MLARLWDNVLFWRRGAAVLATLALLVAAIIARGPPDFSAMPVIAVLRDGEHRPIWAIRLDRAAHQIAADSLRPQPVPPDRVYQLWLSAPDAAAARPAASIGAQADRGNLGKCAPVVGRRRARGHARTHRRLVGPPAERTDVVPRNA